ncbi:MAG TPA: endolytic transglycosylase MltG [Bryobacteraceae bacterium]|nr:endolytic transglycosylase MltG [Bryobacteraceae bacterium]
MVKRLALLAVLLLAAAGLVGYRYFGVYRGFREPVFIDIGHGMSSRDIAAELSRQGVVRADWIFLAVRALRPNAKLQAGEYRFADRQTPWQVFEKIRRGEIFYEDFTVPEGSNIFDIASLADSLGGVKAEEFLRAAGDPAGIRDLDPLAPSLEGYLFPSTYRVTHRTSAAQLCHMMTAEFRKRWRILAGADAHRVTTLASLIEKETGAAAERATVASVFENRLARNMPLQCDPSTVYAALLENRYRGTIYKSDLASTNPYNTYTHAGLPPGPIANPGLASLTAALHPAATDYLYFVARPSAPGSHHFSATLAEHEKAVATFRGARP